MPRAGLILLMLCFVALWGWTFTGVKGAISAFPVIGFLALRFTVATAALAPLAAWRWHPASLMTGSMIGLVLASSYLFQTFGLQFTTPTNNGIITGLFIVFTPVINRLLFGVRTGPLLWGAIAVSVGGLVLLTGRGPDGFNVGDALTLCCAVAMGLHIVLLDRHAPRCDPLSLAFGQIATAAIVFNGLWLATATPAWPSPDVWGIILICGVFATAGAFLVQVYVQQRLSAVQAAAIFVLEPLFAALFAYALAGDRLTAVQWVGAVLMIGAVCVTEIYGAVRKRDRARPAAVMSDPAVQPMVD